MNEIGIFDLNQLSSILEKMNPNHFSKPVSVVKDCYKVDLIRPKVTFKHSKIYEQEIDYALHYLSDYYGSGHCPLMIILTIPVGKSIPVHTDKGADNKISIRHHFPIKTNDDCITTIDGKNYHMDEGKVYTLNTYHSPHGSVNNGNCDRTHLIVDWIV